MIFIVDWPTFQQRTDDATIYVIEKDDMWDMYAAKANAEIMKCSVLKSGDEKDIFFVDKYLSSKVNVVKCLGLDTGMFSMTMFKESVSIPVTEINGPKIKEVTDDEEDDIEETDDDNSTDEMMMGDHS